MKIGTKLVLGVTLASNVCILLLLYSIRYWDLKVTEKSEDLLQIQKSLNTDLRASVTNLQDRLLNLPLLLETNTGKKAELWLKNTQTVREEKAIEGHDNFQSLFTRTERRDLALVQTGLDTCRREKRLKIFKIRFKI